MPPWAGSEVPPSSEPPSEPELPPDELPELPADMKTLPLRLRIEDYRPAKNNLEIVYVGPIRLLELDRQ